MGSLNREIMIRATRVAREKGTDSDEYKVVALELKKSQSDCPHADTRVVTANEDSPTAKWIKRGTQFRYCADCSKLLTGEKDVAGFH